MNQIKILHCADLHLGAELASIGNAARQRREEMLMTFDRIVSLCKEENVELLLIAGDLFESSGVDIDVVHSVQKSLSKIPDTVVAIAPGNHDYISADSPYSEEGWPGNVHIFQTGLTSFFLPEKDVCVWGAAFTGTYVTETLLEKNSISQDNTVQVCVMHGDLVAENQNSNYNPISPVQIRFSGFDYLALGHIHKRTEILKSGATAYAYCGCPEGRGFDELGEKGVYIGTVYKGGADLSFRSVCTRMNLEECVDISGAVTNNEAAEIVLRTLRQRYETRCADHLYKVRLQGALDASYTPDCTAIATRLEKEFYYIKLKDETHIQADLSEFAKENSLKGIFVRKMLDKIDGCKSDEQVSQYERALYIGLKAFDSEVTLREN